MSNTSDTPDANEQVKPTKTRSRTTARSKTESATSISQAQEEKPTVQRRTTSTTRATTAVRTQSASEKVNTQATPEARPTTAQPTTTSAARPATRPAATDGASTYPVQRPAPTQRSRGTASPVQRQTGNAPAQRSAAPGGAPARPGARPTSPSTYRPGGQAHNTTTRTGVRPSTQVRRQPERRVPIVKEKPTGPISIPPQIVVKDLAELLHTTPNEVIRVHS